MPRRPVAVFAIAPWAFPGVFPSGLLLRLRRSADLDAATAFTSFDGPEAARALARAEILLTGWGCPRIDAGVLDAAPGLRAILHAAGTVKAMVDPVVFDRGIVVSSAAQANAVPVADFTVAALVMGAKRAFGRARHYANGDDESLWRPGAGTGLHDCTVGVIGASRIGRLVLHRLRAFDVRVLLSDPRSVPTRPPGWAPNWWTSTRCAGAATWSPCTPPRSRRPATCSTGAGSASCPTRP